ncbi:sulfotransferase family 2 domain-containing protein [Thalassobaculum sp.]|uniref:sulfotransferase family 2 domain-containing protein n=1 Tax=Thalassobaculum sp. TaxID=2022740 RepID=UPI003B590419
MVMLIKQIWDDVFLHDSSSYHVWNKFDPNIRNNKSKIAFLHIPKTGGRQVDNIIMAAREASGDVRSNFFVKYLNRERLCNDNLFPHISDGEFSDFIDQFSYISQHFTGKQFSLVGDEFFKVSLVREPYGRFRSHFLQYIFSNDIDYSDEAELNRAVEYLIEEHSNIFVETYSQFCRHDSSESGVGSIISSGFDFLCTVSYMDQMISSALGSQCDFYILSKNEHFSSSNNKIFAKRFLQKWMDIFIEKNQLDIKFYKFVLENDMRRQKKMRKRNLKRQIIVPPVKYYARARSVYLKPRPFSVDENYRNPRNFGSVFDVYRIKDRGG